MKTNEAKEEIIRKLNKHEIDICCIQETHEATNREITKGNYIIISSAAKETKTK